MFISYNMFAICVYLCLLVMTCLLYVCLFKNTGERMAVFCLKMCVFNQKYRRKGWGVLFRNVCVHSKMQEKGMEHIL